MKKQLLMLAAFTVAATVVSQATLVAHYEFDTDGTATVGTDAALGSAASVSATWGNLSLSGAPSPDTSGDDGAVGGDTFSLGTGARSVSFWMYAAAGDQTDLGTMISLGSTTGAGARYDVRLDADKLRLEVQSGGYTTGTTVADGNWHHVVVASGDSATLAGVSYYVDGSLIGTMSGTRALNTSAGPLRMGDSYQDAGRDFKGTLDDVRLYDHALTQGEVTALNAMAIPEPATLGLVALFGGGVLFIRRRLSI